MNIINENIIRKILSVDEHDINGITNLKWHVDILITKVNSTSELSRLTIKYEKNDVAHQKCILLKVPYNSPTYEICKKLHLYQKEPVIYTEILPRMYAIDDESFTPKIYHVDDKQSLFLEDLVLAGYKNADHVEQLDYEHCCHALKCLAKFHAFSVKLEKTYGLPEALKKSYCYSYDNTDEVAKRAWMYGFYTFYDNLQPDIQEKYKKQIETFKSITFDDLIKIVHSSGTFNVLTHNDFCTNNIMFKYDKYGMIEKVKILDFQASLWTSPAIDLLCFMVTSVKFEVFEKYSDLLLNIYLDTLNKILKTLNCDIYPMEDLKKDLDERFPYAIVAINCILPIQISKPEPNESADWLTMRRRCFTRKNYLEVATKWFLYFAQKNLVRVAD